MGLQETNNPMDNEHNDTASQALYAESVARERQAWQALQSFPPGSIGRSRAWEDWSRAIMLTNQAWRRLSADRLAHPAPRRAPAVDEHARA
jgi:hypothetical protein